MSGKRAKLFLLCLSLLLLGGAFLSLFSPTKNFAILDLTFGNRAFPSVEVNLGGTTINAFIDLGARYTVILDGMIPPSAIEKTAFKTSVALINSKYEDLDLVVLKEVKLGGIKVKNVLSTIEPGDIVPRYVLGKETLEVDFVSRPKVVLGNQLFQQIPFLIDYKNNRLVLAKSTDVLFDQGMLDGSYYKGELLDSDQHFLLKVEIEGQQKKLAIDTGCSVNVLFSMDDEKDFFLSEANVEHLKWEGHLLHMGETYVANRSMGEGFDGFLGDSFIKNHAFVLDLPHKTCWIKPYDTSR